MATTDLKKLLQRHEGFWKREGDRPLKSVVPHVPLEDRGGIPMADGTRAQDGQLITPDLIDPARFYGGTGPSSPLHGNFITGEAPPAICWTEAILGCPIKMVPGGAWADPFFGDWDQLHTLAPSSDWLLKLDAFMELLNERAQGRYPLIQPLFRGPIDLAAAGLGHERFCEALVDEPDRVNDFLDFCVQTFIQSAKRRLDSTPKFEGGYVSSYSIWAPGTVVRNQLDNATLVSPQVYRNQIREHDRKVLEAFDFSLIHVHSGCLHIADELIEIDALRAIQVSIDFPGGPLTHEILPILQKILAHKPLIVTGPVTQDELEALESLEPAGGLCLQLQLVKH